MAINLIPPAVLPTPLLTNAPATPVGTSPAAPIPAVDTTELLLDTFPESKLPPSTGQSARDASSQPEQAAMRADQVFFARQIAWQRPDTATLAASWRVMVRTYGEQRDALLDQARGQHMPGPLLMAERSRTGTPQLALEAELWCFGVYVWNGQRLLLRVLTKDPEAAAPPRLRAPRGKIALRLELVLPEFGRVTVQMEPAGGHGIVLELVTAHASAEHYLRETLPQVAEAVARAGMTIVRCRIRHELAPTNAPENLPTGTQVNGLSQPLFKAMAEVALLLTQPAEAGPGSIG